MSIEAILGFFIFVQLVLALVSFTFVYETLRKLSDSQSERIKLEWVSEKQKEEERDLKKKIIEKTDNLQKISKSLKEESLLRFQLQEKNENLEKMIQFYQEQHKELDNRLTKLYEQLLP